MRISLFMPCFNDALFPGTGIAAVRILEKLGHEVVFPSEQTCCGQIHINTGYGKEARRLLRRFLNLQNFLHTTSRKPFRQSVPNLHVRLSAPAVAKRLSSRWFLLCQRLRRTSRVRRGYRGAGQVTAQDM